MLNAGPVNPKCALKFENELGKFCLIVKCVFQIVSYNFMLTIAKPEKYMCCMYKRCISVSIYFNSFDIRK